MKRCPYCHSTDLIEITASNDQDQIYQAYMCMDCGAEDLEGEEINDL